MNKPNMHNNIIVSILTFQNGLNDFFRSTGFYFISKVIEDEKAMLLNFCALFFKIFVFEVVAFLSCLVVIQSTFNYQNAYGHQTFQSGELLRGAQYLCMTPQSSGLVGSRDK